MIWTFFFSIFKISTLLGKCQYVTKVMYEIRSSPLLSVLNIHSGSHSRPLAFFFSFAAFLSTQCFSHAHHGKRGFVCYFVKKKIRDLYDRYTIFLHQYGHSLVLVLCKPHVFQMKMRATRLHNLEASRYGMEYVIRRREAELPLGKQVDWCMNV